MMAFLSDIPHVITGNIIPALIVLMAVVFVHEMGHFLVARLCGIRVAAFSIGFGRELFGRTDRRGTRWKVSAIPLGGYVRFEGDENMASVPDEEMLAAIPPSERAGLFHFAPLWKRIAVVAAGPAANFVLAILVFASVFVLIGRPQMLPVVGKVVAGSAAEEAGFKPGDRIVSIDGRRIDTFEQLQGIVRLSADESLSVIVDRDSEQVALTASPKRESQSDALGGSHRVGVLGIQGDNATFTFDRDDPATALVEGTRKTGEIVTLTLTYVGRLLRGRESTDQLSGPIGIGQAIGGIPSFSGRVYLTAVLSVSIGLFNLFPVPMLDGGHLLFYLIEAIRGRPLSPRVQDLGFRIGFALVIMLFIFVTFNDIAIRSGIFASS
jgi:regulator of sigma E protease